jgi:hypothetical protein
VQSSREALKCIADCITESEGNLVDAGLCIAQTCIPGLAVAPTQEQICEFFSCLAFSHGTGDSPCGSPDTQELQDIEDCCDMYYSACLCGSLSTIELQGEVYTTFSDSVILKCSLEAKQKGDCDGWSAK